MLNALSDATEDTCIAKRSRAICDKKGYFPEFTFHQREHQSQFIPLHLDAQHQPLGKHPTH